MSCAIEFGRTPSRTARLPHLWGGISAHWAAGPEAPEIRRRQKPKSGEGLPRWDHKKYLEPTARRRDELPVTGSPKVVISPALPWSWNLSCEKFYWPLPLQ